MKPYRKNNVPLAKELRREMTEYERKLWYNCLRYSPVRFQRQKPIGRYIVDFYCATARLVIELDGSQHYQPDQLEYDRRRTVYLEHMGLRVVRYTNLQIASRFREVCDDIYKQIADSISREPAKPDKGIQGE